MRKLVTALAVTAGLVGLAGCDLGTGGVPPDSDHREELPDFDWQQTVVQMPPTASLALVTHTPDGYVALGTFDRGDHDAQPPSGLLAWRSTDGVEWSTISEVHGIPGTFVVQHVVVGEVGFLAVGAIREFDDSEGRQHAIYTSQDGVSWTDITPDVGLLEGESLSIHGAAAGGGGFVVTGTIDFEPVRPRLEIQRGDMTLVVDEDSGSVEILDGAGRVVHTGSIDALQPDVVGEHGVGVFDPDSGERLLVIPWDLVNEHHLNYWDVADDEPETDAPPGSERDQGQIFSTDGLVHLGTDEWSQSVTAGMTGRLAGLQIFLEHETPTPIDFELAIASGADPTAGEVLYSEEVTVTVPGVYTWDLAVAELFFEEGDSFSFSVTTADPGAVVAANDNPGYAGGRLFLNGSPTGAEPTDLAFITYVRPGGAQQGEGGEGPQASDGSLVLDLDGYTFSVFGYDPTRPAGATYEIREAEGGALVAAGDLVELARRPPPRFYAEDGSVLIEFSTWDEFWSARDSAFLRVERTMELERHTRPLAMVSFDGVEWADIELASDIAANQTPHPGAPLWGQERWWLSGFVQNADLGTYVDVMWMSPDGIEWEVSVVQDASRDVRAVTATSFGFLALGETPTGITAVFRSPDGEVWDPALLIEDPPGTFVRFDSLAAGDLGSFVVGVGGVQDAPSDEQAFDGDEDGHGDFEASASTLYFTRDGVTFFEISDPSLDGRFIENILIGDDLILVRVGPSDPVGMDAGDGSSTSATLLVGRPVS